MAHLHTRAAGARVRVTVTVTVTVRVRVRVRVRVSVRVRVTWHIFTPVLQELEALAERPEPYAYGSRGPAGADLLARKFGYTKFGGGIHPYPQAG